MSLINNRTFHIVWTYLPESNNFNCKLSWTRHIVKNVFAVIGNRFDIQRGPINLCPDIAKSIVLTICTLDSFMLSTRNSRTAYLYSTSGKNNIVRFSYCKNLLAVCILNVCTYNWLRSCYSIPETLFPFFWNIMFIWSWTFCEYLGTYYIT